MECPGKCARGDPFRQSRQTLTIGSINVGRIGEPEVTTAGILTVASLDDLVAHKLKVVLQRIEAKDYRVSGCLGSLTRPVPVAAAQT